jgi:hypothetical protein
MKEIVVFSEEEKEAVESIKSGLSSGNKKKAIATIVSNENALRELTVTISSYPSILKQQSLGGISRSVDTLVNNLTLKDRADMIFNIPTKAILGRSFSIAKINFFYMLIYLTREVRSLAGMKDHLLGLAEKIIFSIMEEEVFMSIVSDKKISTHIRSSAAFLLANIWEYRMYQRVREFVPILSNIWRTREKMVPAYGTMIGITEFFRLSDKCDPVWLDFLQRNELEQDEIDSLREFLLGLSYEEMKIIDRYMEEHEKISFNGFEIEKIIGKKPVYPDYLTDDPRDFYRYFVQRKINASYRNRSGVDGPKKTIEEYLMSYLLSRPEEWTNF